MATITVSKIFENQLMKFAVTIAERDSQTKHMVTLNKADYQKVTRGDVQPEELIRKSFEFLLENEPKEQILPQFDFTVIARFFPNFGKEIQKRMDTR